MSRFNTEAQFASFARIVPGIHNSGGTEKCLGITPRSRSQLRSYLIEAAWMAVRKDLEMQKYYRKLKDHNYFILLKNPTNKVADFSDIWTISRLKWA